MFVCVLLLKMLNEAKIVYTVNDTVWFWLWARKRVQSIVIDDFLENVV